MFVDRVNRSIIYYFSKNALREHTGSLVNKPKASEVLCGVALAECKHGLVCADIRCGRTHDSEVAVRYFSFESCLAVKA